MLDRPVPASTLPSHTTSLCTTQLVCCGGVIFLDSDIITTPYCRASWSHRIKTTVHRTYMVHTYIHTYIHTYLHTYILGMADSTTKNRLGKGVPSTVCMRPPAGHNAAKIPLTCLNRPTSMMHPCRYQCQCLAMLYEQHELWHVYSCQPRRVPQSQKVQKVQKSPKRTYILHPIRA